MIEVTDLMVSEAQEIITASKNLEKSKVRQLVDVIDKSHGDIFLTGCGTSAMAAKKITHTLNVVGKKSFYLNPSDAVHGQLGAVTKGDLIIFISKGGNTKELTSFLNNLQRKDVYICYIGQDENSILGQAANLFIHVKIKKEIDRYGLLATASTLTVISLFDAIASVIEDKDNYSKDKFLLNHPSGAVGSLLSEEYHE